MGSENGGDLELADCYNIRWTGGLEVQRHFAAGVAVSGGRPSFKCGLHQSSVMRTPDPKSDLKYVLDLWRRA